MPKNIMRFILLIAVLLVVAMAGCGGDGTIPTGGYNPFTDDGGGIAGPGGGTATGSCALYLGALYVSCVPDQTQSQCNVYTGYGYNIVWTQGGICP